MNSPTDFDIGPLTWVKSEIDLALERGDKALQQFTASLAEETGDLTEEQMQEMRTAIDNYHLTCKV